MVQARVPGDIQDSTNQVIQASGLTASDVIRVLMTRIAQDKIIPPELFEPNKETLAAPSLRLSAGVGSCHVRSNLVLIYRLMDSDRCNVHSVRKTVVL
jgi:addiction module RelB/DinJ family antitoxin